MSRLKKTRALRVISEHLIAGRWDDVRRPTAKELKATSVLEFSIEEASAKIRTGQPVDDEEDYSLSVWAGILPLTLEAKPPISRFSTYGWYQTATVRPAIAASRIRISTTSMKKFCIAFIVTTLVLTYSANWTMEFQRAL